MLSFIFDLIQKALACAWELLTALLSLGWRLLTTGVDITFRIAGNLLDLMFTPFTWGLDMLWDIGAWSLPRVFLGVLSLLLLACVLLGALAVCKNISRRYGRHLELPCLPWRIRKGS